MRTASANDTIVFENGETSYWDKTIDDLQVELDKKYTKFVKNPAIVVQVTQSDTPLQDLVERGRAVAEHDECEQSATHCKQPIGDPFG